MSWLVDNPKSKYLLLIAFLGSLFCFQGPLAWCGDQAGGAEVQLRKRMTGYWEAMARGDFETAAGFIHPDSQDVFRNRISKTRYGKWRIEKLDFNGDQTLCETLTYVEKSFPLAGAPIDWPIRNQWVLDKGDWYLKIPWGPGSNPMLDLMKSQEAVVKQTEELRRLPPAPPSKSAGIQRIMADPENPAALHSGEKAVFKYRFRNDGQVPIRVVSVYSDCHCTGVEKDASEIEPEGSGVLRVMLDTFGLPLGLIRKEIYVQFSDQPEPVVLELTVSNLPNFVLSPEKIDFGTVTKGAPAEMAVHLTNRSRQSVRIVSRLKSDERLEVAFSRMSLDPGEGLDLSISFKTDSTGEFMANVMIQTDLAAEPLITIPVRGRVQ